MNIRIANTNDYQYIINLSDPALGKGYVTLNNIIENKFWVAEQDNEIVGFVSVNVDDDLCTILQMVVSPDHRRKGIAQQLITYILENIEVSSYKTHAWEYSDTKNVPLASPLEQCGFERIEYLNQPYKEEHGASSPCSVCGFCCLCGAWLYRLTRD